MTLPDNVAARLRGQVSSGRFRTEAEALSAAVALLEAADAAEGPLETEEVETLVLAAHRSLASTGAVPFDTETIGRIRAKGTAILRERGA